MMILEHEPATEFEEVGTVQFVATFRRKNVEVSSSVLIGDPTTKSSEKILVIVALDPTVSARHIAEMLKLSPRGVEKQLNILKRQDRLKRIGPNKGGHWEIVRG
jgi:ATP-dependent DNA helicase RecG